jgi:hypothetical protein
MLLGADAGPTDGGCGGPATSVTLDVHVVLGPSPVRDAPDVGVLAEGECGLRVETRTDAAGHAALELADAGRPWSITIARSGYAAVSVMAVTDVAFDGDIRLDPTIPETVATRSVSGNVAGALPVGHYVQIDCLEFQTVARTGIGAWTSRFYTAPSIATIPLRCVAIEMDASGRAVHFTVTERARPMIDTSGFDFAFTSGAEPSIAGSLTVHRPTTGLLASATFPSVPAVWEMQPDGQWVATGTATTIGDRIDYLSFASIPPNHLIQSFESRVSFMRLNVYHHELGARDDEVVIEPLLADSAAASDGSLATLSAMAEGGAWDVLALHIDESEMRGRAPRWRVFAPMLEGRANITRLPHLPTGIILGDIGMAPGSAIQILPLVVRMHTGRAWSTRASFAGVPEYAYTAAPLPIDVAASGR